MICLIGPAIVEATGHKAIWYVWQDLIITDSKACYFCATVQIATGKNQHLLSTSKFMMHHTHSAHLMYHAYAILSAF